MTRFNYAPSRFERTFGAASSQRAPIARGPLLALAASLVLVAAIVFVQAFRLRALGGAAAVLNARSAALQPALARLHSAEADVRRLEAQVAEDRGARRSGTLRANEIAAIGNALPAQTWLTGVRIEQDAVALEGRCARMRGVADALAALARVDGIATVRLISAKRDATRSDVAYEIALERRP